MRTFTLTDLKNQTGKVVDAAIRGPVSLTKHGAETLVLMSREDFDRVRAAADYRTAHSLNELPTEFARDMVAALEAVTPESYGGD